MKNNNKGFSLVELIVVIAIMAILVAVAVVGFSMYIPKAQQASDKQMISDIEYALTLAGYENIFEEGETGLIILSTSGVSTESEKIDTILKNLYGENYSTSIKLEYDEWGNTVVSFKESSYNDKTESLLGTVTNLTGALSNFMSNPELLPAIGPNFSGYLTDKGINPATDPTAAGNAAVLYVAQNTVGKDAAVQNAIASAISKPYDGMEVGSDEWADAVVNEMTEQLQKELGTAGGMAAMYAYAEAFGQNYSKTDDGELLDKFHNEANFDSVADAGQAVTQVENSFKVFLTDAGAVSAMNSYTKDKVGNTGKTQSELDIEGYLAAMEMIDESSTTLSGSLSDTDSFVETATQLMTSYLTVSDGQIGIMCQFSEGVLTITNTLPKDE